MKPRPFKLSDVLHSTPVPVACSGAQKAAGEPSQNPIEIRVVNGKIRAQRGNSGDFAGKILKLAKYPG